VQEAPAAPRAERGLGWVVHRSGDYAP
jgi:hypothetical protein